MSSLCLTHVLSLVSTTDLILTPDRGQFQCPLCNKIGNFLLPIYQLDKSTVGSAIGASEEQKESSSWMDWILTDTERGKKRELSKESESREDILAALDRDENEDEEDANEPQSDLTSDTSGSLSERISLFFHRMAPQTFFGRPSRSQTTENRSTNRMVHITPSQQEFRTNKEAVQKSCFRFGICCSWTDLSLPGSFTKSVNLFSAKVPLFFEIAIPPFPSVFVSLSHLSLTL
jgi:hypothetical protein